MYFVEIELMVYKNLKLLTLSPRTICKRELLWEKGLSKNISYALLKGKPLAAAPLQRWSLQVSIQPRIFLPRNVNDPHCEFMSSIMHVRITMLSFDSTNQKNMVALLKCSKFMLVMFLGGANILNSKPQISLPLVPTTFKQKFARSFFHVLSAKYSYWSLIVSLRCSYSVWLKSTATGAYFKKYNFIFESSADFIIAKSHYLQRMKLPCNLASDSSMLPERDHRNLCLFRLLKHR